MGKLSRMGKPPFLKPHHVQKDDLLEVLQEPYVQSEEDSKYGRARGYSVVRLVRTGETYTWGMNTTTWDRLLDAFGEDSNLWIGKKVKLKLETQTIRGEEKTIMYAVPYENPQKNLSQAEQAEQLREDLRTLNK